MLIILVLTNDFCHKTSLKQKSTTDKADFPRLSKDLTATVTTDDPSQYQELGDMTDDNAYPTLKQQ